MPAVIQQDAEKFVSSWCRDLLTRIPDPEAAGVKVGTRLQPGITPAHFIQTRRVGGTRSNRLRDVARIDFLIWHDDDGKRMRLASTIEGYAATELRAAEFSGPQQMPDPTDDAKTVVMFTIEIPLRGVQR